MILHGAPNGIRKPRTGVVSSRSTVNIINGQGCNDVDRYSEVMSRPKGETGRFTLVSSLLHIKLGAMKTFCTFLSDIKTSPQ